MKTPESEQQARQRLEENIFLLKKFIEAMVRRPELRPLILQRIRDDPYLLEMFRARLRENVDR